MKPLRECEDTHLHRTLVGEGPPIQQLKDQIRRYSRTEASILVIGETGAGKERCAELLHRLSLRSHGPFISLNCAAIPHNLIESELFGTVPGAFTGARKRTGCFSAARGGTLFLDELGDMSMRAQCCLLRVLETKSFRPVGSDRTVSTDVRVICATHQDLKQAVQEGRFRADLLHRLATIIIEVPPLRERLSDVGAIVSDLFPEADGRLSSSAWSTILAHEWPGNIRELKNVIWRGLIDSDGGPIDSEHLNLSTPRREKAQKLETDILPLHEALTVHIQKSLEQCEGNVRATSRALQVSPTTVYRYLALSKGIQARTIGAQRCSVSQLVPAITRSI